MTELLSVMPRYKAYKDSGVAWIGEIPKSWVLIRGSYIFKIINKRSKNGNEALLTVSEHHGVKLRAESNVNMFMAESYVGYKICYPGDLVINSLWAWSRGLGFSNIHGIVSTAYSVFRPDTFKYDKSFLNYLLRTKKYVDQYFIASKGIWISRLQLSDSAFLKIPILSPPISEQTTIANFLDCKTTKIDQAVTIKEKQIQLLKERKQILIQTAVTKGLDPNVPMADSGVEWIGQVPSHWAVKRLKYLFTECNKRTETGSETLFSLRMEKGLIPHNEVSDKHISDENLINYKLVFPGQLVMNRMRASIGIFGLATDSGLVSPDYAVFNTHTQICAEYYLLMFKTKLLGTQFRLNSRGMGTGSSGFMRLYTENFGDIKIPCPSLKEQKSIVSHIHTQSAKIDKAIAIQEQIIEKLKEYKATLINAAVTGKIKVPDPAESKVVA